MIFHPFNRTKLSYNDRVRGFLDSLKACNNFPKDSRCKQTCHKNLKLKMYCLSLCWLVIMTLVVCFSSYGSFAYEHANVPNRCKMSNNLHESLPQWGANRKSEMK